MVNRAGIIAKISKGTKMDQIYLPKIRSGLNTGEYVLIQQISADEMTGEKEKTAKSSKPIFYNLKYLEPIKMQIIEKVFEIIGRESPENIIITGSFLEKGFNFNDIDVLVISNDTNLSNLKKEIEKATGIPAHLIVMDNKTLIAGLSSDPLYEMMLSKSVSKKKVIFNIKRQMNYKLLDLNLLKSKTMIDNFEILNGYEKYYFTLNLISILLFINNKKISKKSVNNEIEKLFKISVKAIKDNMAGKGFFDKYKEIYTKTQNLIFNNIK